LKQEYVDEARKKLNELIELNKKEEAPVNESKELNIDFKQSQQDKNLQQDKTSNEESNNTPPQNNNLEEPK
jgi:hypothetical protein